jgi:hypothetical protein
MESAKKQKHKQKNKQMRKQEAKLPFLFPNKVKGTCTPDDVS